MKKTTASESNLAVCNYALGYADRLVAPHLRRNQPTEERYWDDFRRGLSDAERRRPFDPPGTQANDARRGGERIGAPWRTTGRTVANNREGDGKVWTCGWAQYGRLGLSDAESAAAGGGLLYGKYLAVPKQVGGISGVAAIGGGRPQRRCRGDGTGRGATTHAASCAAGPRRACRPPSTRPRKSSSGSGRDGAQT